jgi:hypothetical protein
MMESSPEEDAMAVQRAVLNSEHEAERARPLHEFAYIDRPFRDVRRRLADRPDEIVPAAASARLAGLDLSRDLRLSVGDLQIGHRTAWLTVGWEDPRHPGLFPRLCATLEFMPVAAGHRATTQVGLRGHYEPPLGRMGALADTLVGHTIVVRSVRAFLGELATHLEQALPAATC